MLELINQLPYPYSHVCRPHSCISRALTFAYIFFQKNNFTFSRKGSYNQGFLQSGVLTVRVSYNLGSYIPGFLQSGGLQSGVLTIRGSYNQGFLRSGVLTIRGLTIRGSYD